MCRATLHERKATQCQELAWEARCGRGRSAFFQGISWCLIEIFTGVYSQEQLEARPLRVTADHLKRAHLLWPKLLASQ